MTQLQMEDELWLSRRMREDEEKKISILNQENKKLHEKLEDLQDSIDKKSKKISRLNSQNQSLKQERSTLENKLTQAISKCSRIQSTLKERNEEYCKLYSYLFTESRNAIQKSFLAEMNLNTQISELQHQTDAKIIEKLQLKIKQKNQESLTYQKRIGQLHEALLTSTFEYHEKISELQNHKRVLQIQLQSKYIPEQEETETINEYCFKKKIEGLQNQVCLYVQQISRLRQESKAQTQQFKRLQQRNTELEIFESKRQKFKNINDEIFTVIEENNKMRDQVEELQREKQNLIMNMPYFEDQQTLLGRLYTLEKEYIQIKNENTSLNTQNLLLQSSKDYLLNKNEQLLETQANAIKRYESLKIISTSAFEKLKNVIKTYSPYYFRSFKLESYDLNKEQQQLIKGQICEETLSSAYKQINKVQRENENFKKQNVGLSQRVFQLANINEQLEKELSEKKQEIEKLGTACLQLIQKNNENQQIQDLMEQQQEQEIVQKNLQIKVQILQKCVEEYQSDRREIINMIKSKDLKIAQLNAEIEALKNISDATVIYVKPSPIQSFIQRAPVESSKQSQMIFEGSLSELRSQLIQISKAHNEEKEELIRQYERKQSESLTKYFALLKEYDCLCEKLSKLESSTQNIAKHSQLIQQQKYPIIQEAPSVFHHVQSRQQNPQQNTFSEKAIQTFTDILKKYQKQINKYVTIYQEQLKKWTQQADQKLYSEVAEDSVIGNNKQIENLLQIIKKHQETILNLQEANQNITKEFQILITDLQNQLNTSNSVSKQLTNRLEQAEKTILSIRNSIFDQKLSFDFSSSQSANTAFLTLNFKNKQIQTLKNSYQKLKQSYEQKCKQTVSFTQKSTNLSTYELQQFKVFKEIIQQQDLLSILQAAAKRLQ